MLCVFIADALPSSRTHLFAFSAHKHFIPILQRHCIFFSHYDLFCNSLKKNLNKLFGQTNTNMKENESIFKYKH